MCVCACVCVLLQGFEPRGTYIGVRQSRLFLLQENTGPGKTLSHLPQHLNQRLKHTHCYKTNKNTLLPAVAAAVSCPTPSAAPMTAAEAAAEVKLSPGVGQRGCSLQIHLQKRFSVALQVGKSCRLLITAITNTSATCWDLLAEAQEET